MKSGLFRLFLLIVTGALAGLMPMFAQAPASGIITGRVFNPNTGDDEQ